MRTKFGFMTILLCLLLLVPLSAICCTTILVGKSLTADGSVLHGHNEDMGFVASGRLWSVKAQTHDQGQALKVPYVKIPQVKETYQYWASGNTLSSTGLGVAAETRPYDSVLVGMNQWGVTMSCNWMWSKEKNLPNKGIRRYAVRQLILERAKTARQAVQIVADFIDKYGQADWGGLTYNLADPKEAWVLETTSQHWVARKVRDNELWVVANRFTIGKEFDLSSKGLKSFAQKMGWFDPKQGDFSFKDFYGRPDRMNQAYDKDREARGKALLQGKQGFITPEDLFLILRDRYEGTPKYTKPLKDEIWREVSEGRMIPRAIATNLCQSSSVAQLRGDMPVQVGSVMWYAMAAPHYSGFFPVYAGATKIPAVFSNVNSAYSPDSAWWAFRMLQKVADTNYNLAYPMLHNFWTANHANILIKQAAMEARAVGLFNKKQDKKALELINAFTFSQAADAFYHCQRMLRLLQDAGGSVAVW